MTNMEQKKLTSKADIENTGTTSDDKALQRYTFSRWSDVALGCIQVTVQVGSVLKDTSK